MEQALKACLTPNLGPSTTFLYEDVEWWVLKCRFSLLGSFRDGCAPPQLAVCQPGMVAWAPKRLVTMLEAWHGGFARCLT